MINDRLVLVRWIDANTDHGWVDRAEIKIEPHKVHSIGWVISQDKGQITLAATKSDNFVNGTITIPMVWVEQVITLKEPAA